MFGFLKKLKFPHDRLTSKILLSIERYDVGNGARMASMILGVTANEFFRTPYPKIKDRLEELKKLEYIEEFEQYLPTPDVSWPTTFYRLTPKGVDFINSKLPPITLEIGKWYVSRGGVITRITHVVNPDTKTYSCINGLTYHHNGTYVGMMKKAERSLVREFNTGETHDDPAPIASS
jgi:ribosomal protein S8